MDFKAMRRNNAAARIMQERAEREQRATTLRELQARVDYLEGCCNAPQGDHDYFGDEAVTGVVVSLITTTEFGIIPVIVPPWYEFLKRWVG